MENNYRNTKYTLEEIQEKMDGHYKNPGLQVINYSGQKNPAKVYCPECGWTKEYLRGEYIFKNKTGCPQCCGPNKPRLTLEEAQLRIDNLFGAEEYQIIKFEKESAPILFKHKCGYCFTKTKLSNMIKSTGCPKCKTYSSKGEKEIAGLLKKWKIPYSTEVKFEGLIGKSSKGPLRFDFAINEPKLLLIEFDGPQHYEKGHYNSDFEQQKINDKKKDIYCEEHNIPLLRIPYWNFKKIPSIIKDFLILNDYPFGEYTSSEVETLDTEM